MRSLTVLQAGLGMVLKAGSVSLAVATDTASDNKDMVLIPKGEFTMGSSEHSDEFRHQVVLVQSGFTRQQSYDSTRPTSISSWLIVHSTISLLGHLVAGLNEYRPKDLTLRYGELFMQALAVKATIRKHVNVLPRPARLSLPHQAAP